MSISEEKLGEIYHSSMRIAAQGSGVPLGSLAHAVARELENCLISLWPAVQRREGDKRASVYVAEQGSVVEYLILYGPSDSETDGDWEIRSAVAHELAHLLLGHPPRTTPKNPVENGVPLTAEQRHREFEADYYASLLLLWLGTVTERAKPDIEHIEDFLESGELLREEQEQIISRIHKFM